MKRKSENESDQIDIKQFPQIRCGIVTMSWWQEREEEENEFIFKRDEKDTIMREKIGAHKHKRTISNIYSQGDEDVSATACEYFENSYTFHSIDFFVELVVEQVEIRVCGWSGVDGRIA